jgi:RHS repeat-associated core domain
MVNFAYDSRNRLISTGDTNYTYDALNNRVALTENETTTRYVVNPNATYSKVLMETDGQGNILKYYVYGLGLLSSEDSNNYSLYHYDQKGNTVALTNLSGQVTDRISYDPFGTVVSRTGTTATPFLFSGQYGVSSDANELIYMRARYYNPQIKSFISQDTLLGSIDNVNSMNRYAYAQGNPILYVDPSGHFVATVTGGLIGGLIGGVSAALNGTDITTGIVSGTVSGAIVGLTTDIVIASGGTALVAVGAIGFAGGIGGVAGEIISQIGNRTEGVSVNEAVQYLDGSSV